MQGNKVKEIGVVQWFISCVVRLNLSLVINAKRGAELYLYTRTTMYFK